MKQLKSFIFFYIVFLIQQTDLHSQESYCKNLGFELGNFTNWVGYTWVYSTDEPDINTSKVMGIVGRRHTIMTDTNEYDINTGNELRKIPPGYKFSARIGDAITNSDYSPRCWEQCLRYTMTIDSNNALLVMKFALVLQYASNHSKITEPRFRLTLYDKNGVTIPDCANYDVYSSNEDIKGFHTYIPSDGQDTVPVQWRDWTTVGANLLKYIGQTITIEFMSADCTKHFHYGYAYFVAECHPLCITVNYCADDSIASLVAPEGFETYSWTNSSGTTIDTLRTIYLINAIEGATYSCRMTSATGCTVNLQSIIARYIPKVDFNSYMIDCNSNTVQLNNFSLSTHGSLSYLWDFGDGNISTEKNPRYTFITSGRHQVTLNLRNPPSNCIDKLTKEVESFSPPLVGINGDSTYCPGLSVFIKAYGAYDYTWNNGLKTDSIEITAPGGMYWLIGRSSTGCVSDTNFEFVSEEPDWEFLAEGDTIVCEGDSIELKISGALNYFWNTGDTTNSIIVATTGKYTGIGANKRGCEKSKTFNVLESPLPLTDFFVTPAQLDSKNNQIISEIPTESDVKYIWNMDDGSTETGSTVHHTYNITNSVLAYTIKLTAINKFSCVDSAFTIIDIVPFVPNVFSPNGDGINDIFMPDIDLHIFDRGGLLLYQGTSGWDGTYNGKSANPDTYFYLITYSDRNQQEHNKKGYITLVR
jgi:gliding motility-associated-like protein